jgi:hypothetical protein
VTITNNTTISIGLVVTLVAVGTAWGSLKATVDRHDRDIESVNGKIDAVLKAQRQLVSLQAKALAQVCDGEAHRILAEEIQ